MSDVTITQSELGHVLTGARFTFQTDSGNLLAGTLKYPDLAAAYVFQERENYKEGGVYKDANCDVYQFDIDAFGTKRWFAPGTTFIYPYSAPKRPLRELK